MDVPWIDIIVGVILLISIIIGAAKGFLKSLIGLFGTVITLALSIWLAKPFAELLDSIWNLSGTFGGMLEPMVQDAFNSPGILTMLLGSLFGPVSTPITAAEITAVAANMGSLLTIIVAVVGLYIGIKIALWLLSKLFDVITKNRAISGLDRLLGLVFGLARGVLFVFIGFGIIFFLSTYIPTVGTWFQPLLDASPVSDWAYKLSCEFIENTLIPWIMK